MTLSKHSHGKEVQQLQQRLTDLGLYKSTLDGIFGSLTDVAVRTFQENNHLEADGIVGPITWRSLFPDNPSMTSTLATPPAQNQCIDVFGNFQDPSWDAENLTQCNLSFAKKDLKHVHNFVHDSYFGFYCHKLVALKFQAAFKNIVDRGLASQIVTFDGCLNKRKMRGSNDWSMHSWAIAIDINAATNAFGALSFSMTNDVAKCFEDVGFVWGGRWKYPDAMHFQYATI